MRGTDTFTGMQHGPLGITPACAGNSCVRPVYCGCTGDHPRVCGEQSRTGVRGRPPGSPPRVRGTAISGGKYTISARITPACAGNRCILPFLPHRKRITPACAGNSSSLMPLASSRRDHPRVCGEQLSTLLNVTTRVVGSPPRVRGTEQTSSGGTYIGGSPPRVRGTAFIPPSPSYGGSPPRVRGTEFCVPYRDFVNGSPPRVRGTGTSHSLRLSCSQDHPRVCGEQMRLADGQERGQRITPACAGNRQPTAAPYVSPAGSPPRVRGTDFCIVR